MAVAEYIWTRTDDDNDESMTSPHLCVSSFPFMPGGCWSQLIPKVLGMLIILGACFNQVPMMLNLYNSKSALGLSKAFLYGDLLIKANASFYGFLAGFPITSYGENIALWIQSTLVLLLAWQYGRVSVQEKLLAISAGCIYIFAVTKVLPPNLRYLLMASIWPLLFYSRGAQIIETHRVKHTGANSIITTGSNLVGGLIRVGTTIAEVGNDVAMLTGLIISVSLNAIAVSQYIIYKRNTDKLYKSGAKDKKKKV